MTTEALHPDHLQPGSMVGPWRIVEVLGAGGFGRVFRAERDGALYALKMALRPGAAEAQPGEEDVDGRFAQEVAVLLAHASQPGLLPVHAVDRWPDARTGYRYFVTDYVEGDTFHSWRWRAHPSAARLVEVFSRLVHTLGELHRRGVHHRDLKAENILIRREDERPVLIDFGTVRLPGAPPLTVGRPPPGTLHIQPPEVAAFILDGAWKDGARFDAGVAGDLYALGVLLYEALTDGHPFRPSLGTEPLLVAIETVVPRAPHYVNPKVPLALSRICMRLLAKRPEERYESAEALLQALWVTARERKSRAWRTPLDLPPGGPAPMTAQEAEERKAQEAAASPGGADGQAAEILQLVQTLFERMRPVAPTMAPRPKHWKWLAALGGSFVLVLALGLALRATLAPPVSTEKGSASVSPPSASQSTSPSQESPPSVPARLAMAWLCATAGLACPGAQVKLPERGSCPAEARRVMFEELGLTPLSPLWAITDINQPGKGAELGTFRDGPLVGRITDGAGTGLPEGTLLYGRIWTGPDIYDIGREAVVVRYTEAKLPEGRRIPVCIVLGGPDGRALKWEGSKPGAARLPRQLAANAVDVWPWPE